MSAKESVNSATNAIAVYGMGGNIIADQDAETMVFFNLISTETYNQKSVHPKFPALQQARDIVFSFEVIRASKHIEMRGNGERTSLENAGRGKAHSATLHAWLRVRPINVCDLLYDVEIRRFVRFWWTCVLGSRECVNVCVD